MNTIDTIERKLQQLKSAANAGFGYPQENVHDIVECLPALVAVAKAADAVNARWETPTWKSAEPTAKLMNELRDALAKLKEQGNG